VAIGYPQERISVRRYPREPIAQEAPVDAFRRFGADDLDRRNAREPFLDIPIVFLLMRIGIIMTRYMRPTSTGEVVGQSTPS
jgi:hypothetical protein